MKFHEVVEQFIDAKREYEDHEDSEHVSNRDNAKTMILKRDIYTLAAKTLDKAYELALEGEPSINDVPNTPLG